MTGPARIVRDIVAPHATVFAALSSVEGMEAWLAPHRYSVFDLVADICEGGSYRAAIGDEGNREIVTGDYIEITPPHRLRISWCWPDTDPADVSLIDIDLLQVGAVTRVAVSHGGCRSDGQRQSRVRAWTSCLDKLAAWTECAPGQGNVVIRS